MKEKQCERKTSSFTDRFVGFVNSRKLCKLAKLFNLNKKQNVFLYSDFWMLFILERFIQRHLVTFCHDIL